MKKELAKKPEPELQPNRKLELVIEKENKKEKRERKALAQKEKEASNAAYKKKDFEATI